MDCRDRRPGAVHPMPDTPAAADDDLLSLDFTTYVPPPVEEPQRPSVTEQAARLHAAGDNAAACAILETALRGGESAADAEAAWGMLFDLYQALGRRREFEALALDYAAKFEKSPPTWPVTDAEKPLPGQGGPTTVSLSGVLGANAVQPLGKLRDMAGKMAGLRLDLSKVQDADDAGCAALLETLHFFRKAKKPCVLADGEKLAARLAGRTVMGERQHEPAWRVLLELYQALGRQEAFEETAVNYAVTFEVSPPSWETRERK